MKCQKMQLSYSFNYILLQKLRSFILVTLFYLRGGEPITNDYLLNAFRCLIFFLTGIWQFNNYEYGLVIQCQHL